MKKILAFAASNSQNSINKELAEYTANHVNGAEVIVLDLNDFEMPIYGIDKENKNGIPALALQFKEAIKNADAIVISFAEHNGNFAAAYKNIYDWVSRIEKDFWYNKPMFLLATSPGARGGIGVLEIASKAYGYSNKNTVVDFSLPLFHANFDSQKGIIEPSLKSKFEEKLEEFKKAVTI